MSNTISHENYVKWVQRSLNRVMAAGLRDNGVIDDAYYDAVSDFKLAYGMTPDGIVDSPVQNKLIKANEGHYSYIHWVQVALNEIGPWSLHTNGIKGDDTIKAIKGFQDTNGLTVDGFVGAKTDTELVKQSGIKPPGTDTTPSKKGGKKPVPPVPPDPVTDEQTTRLWVKGMIHRIRIGTYKVPDETQRKRLLCLLKKLSESGYNYLYVQQQYAREYVLTDKHRGLSVDQIATNAKEKLTKRVGKLRRKEDPDEAREDFHQQAMWLYYEIESGLYEIYRLNQTQGYEAQMKALLKWGMDKQAKSSSILSCFV